MSRLSKTVIPRHKSSWWWLLRADVRSVLERDPAAHSLVEVWTIYPGIHAIAARRLAHALWQREWRYLPRWRSLVARMFTHIDIHPSAHVGERFFIDHVPEGATVVGIPGRIVRSRKWRTTHGFDLDHHLISNPVGKAISCLLDRVAQLEQAQSIPSADTTGSCNDCDEVCGEPTFYSQPSSSACEA